MSKSRFVSQYLTLFSHAQWVGPRSCVLLPISMSYLQGETGHGKRDYLEDPTLPVCLADSVTDYVENLIKYTQDEIV